MLSAGLIAPRRNGGSSTAHSNIMLRAQLHRAAALTEVGRRRLAEVGRRRLDSLAAQARANTVAAASAKSPAAQRAILANLTSLARPIRGWWSTSCVSLRLFSSPVITFGCSAVIGRRSGR
jgi:hypothetical protein